MQFQVTREVVLMVMKRLCHRSTRLTLGSGNKSGEAFKVFNGQVRQPYFRRGANKDNAAKVCPHTKPSLPRHLDNFILGHFNTPIEYGNTPDTGAVQIRCHYS
jgi:hypothetical protein